MGFVLMALAIPAGVRADLFLDVVFLTPGAAGVGSFSGTLGGVSVSGSISSLGGPPVFSFTSPGPGLGDSTIDGSSPQFGHAGVFSPVAAAADRVGFTYTALAGNLVTLAFGSPVTDPVFHVANLDWAAFSFAPTPGFSSLTLLAGNDGMDGDGVDPAFGGGAYSFALVRDMLPPTTDTTPPAGAPPVAGDRSAYASVRINGTFSSLSFVTDAMGPFADGGSFSLSRAVPEAGSAVLVMVGSVVLAGFARQRGAVFRTAGK